MKDKKNWDVEHERWMSFEKQLAVFLGEFDAHVQIADDENRFLTPQELHDWEERLRMIWEAHIKNREQEKWLEIFRKCYSCQHRNTTTNPLMTIGIIRCQNPECKHHKKFNEMFNAVYTKRDIDRAKEHMDEMLQTPEDFEPTRSMMSGETLERNTDKKQKQHIELREKEKESKEMMYQ